MTRWQIDKMTNWQDDKLTSCQIDKLTNWQDGLSKDAKSWQSWPKVDKTCQKLMTLATRSQMLLKLTKFDKTWKSCQEIEKFKWLTWLLDHPSAISFFRVHTILHDILGFDTIITRYTRYFKSVKNCVFFLKACSGDSRQLAKKRVNYNFFWNLSFPVSDHL